MERKVFPGIEAFLNETGLMVHPDHAKREQGNLNTVYFLQDLTGKEYVLRLQKNDRRDDIEMYIQEQMKFLGVSSMGVRQGYRSMDVQAVFMQHLESIGVFVPHVKDYGLDWMLMDFVKGRSLKEDLPFLTAPEANKKICQVLSPFMDIHENGECLWDRWGGNELIDQDGNVCFIDFDILFEWPENIPITVQVAFDMVFMLRSCLQFSVDRISAAEAIAVFICQHKNFSKIYDLPSLFSFIDGQIGFYGTEYIENPKATAEDKEKHLSINSGMKKIRREIEKLARKAEY